ncbi:Ran-binding proteins 9/10 [Tetrabaena socialis]|uniref:Ran-binding proteins 9/10 n=1 Tax=Tetrabaena socialis TaxID=47790 RepID=A0A2J8ACT0_9CHLO|nr:Ran-binding proteins 9/10 [Tetrabaena socialis]|eukprot:PNH10322.1 Ran-binding proteins 9/10 [Tetrabaena socialis]
MSPPLPISSGGAAAPPLPSPAAAAEAWACPFRSARPLPSRLDCAAAPTVRAAGTSGLTSLPACLIIETETPGGAGGNTSAAGGGGGGAGDGRDVSTGSGGGGCGGGGSSIVDGGGGAMVVRYCCNGSGYFHRQAASLRTDLPVPPDCPLYFFEARVLDGGEDGSIGIGFSAPSVPLNRLPGWDAASYGYHGDDGNRFSANGRGSRYGPKYGAGDVVVALWDRST